MKVNSNTKQINDENHARELFSVVAEALETSAEWLFSTDGSQAALKRDELDVLYKAPDVFLQYNTFDGEKTQKLLGVEFEERKLLLTLWDYAADEEKTVELIPRITAAELNDSIKQARLEMAHRIAHVVATQTENARIANVRLSQGVRAGEFGTNAQILLQISREEQIAVFAPVVAKVGNADSFLASAVTWFVSAAQRAKKCRIEKLWLIADKRAATKLKKIIALMRPQWSKNISIFLIDLEKQELKEIKVPEFRNLWREKPRKLKPLSDKEMTDTAREISAIDAEAIDITYSAHGENLRFHGLPFFRVRTLLGEEKSWFGTDKKKQIFEETSLNDLSALVDELKEKRSASADNRDHYFYRASPEHWLESMLRRDITQLDGNLVLSPIYQQFRVSAEQIDLLALRKDGQLVVIELKVSPSREVMFQAANYWRLIELQRRSGKLAEARAFGNLKIADVPALVYLVAPALSFHYDLDFWAGLISPKIEIYKYQLHENWRENIKVLQRDKL